jgi:hypothetical protein
LALFAENVFHAKEIGDLSAQAIHHLLALGSDLKTLGHGGIAPALADQIERILAPDLEGRPNPSQNSLLLRIVGDKAIDQIKLLRDNRPGFVVWLQEPLVAGNDIGR